MFTVALYTIAMLWKQPNCPSTDEWIKRWHIYIYKYTLEYYSATRNEILPFATTWMDIEDIMLSEINQRKTNTMLSLTCGI